MNKGFITLFLLVVVLGATLAGVLSIALRTMYIARADQQAAYRLQAIASAEACVEEALEVLRSAPATTSGSIDDDPIECSYTVSGSYDISATGTYQGVERTLDVSVSSVNPTTITSWQQQEGW